MKIDPKAQLDKFLMFSKKNQSHRVASVLLPVNIFKVWSF